MKYIKEINYKGDILNFGACNYIKTHKESVISYYEKKINNSGTERKSKGIKIYINRVNVILSNTGLDGLLLSMKGRYFDLFDYRNYNIDYTEKLKELADSFDINLKNDLKENEKRILCILDNILKSDKVIIINNLDSGVHSLCVKKIIKYIRYETDKQIIFTLNGLDNINLFNFKKDEIHFVNYSSHYNIHELYSLFDFKIDFRKRNDIMKMYKLGAFGAIPFIN